VTVGVVPLASVLFAALSLCGDQRLAASWDIVRHSCRTDFRRSTAPLRCTYALGEHSLFRACFLLCRLFGAAEGAVTSLGV